MSALDPRSRILAAVLFAAVAVTLQRVDSLLAALLLAVVLAAAAELQLRPTLRRLAAIDGFMLVMVAALPFTMAGEAVLPGWPLSAAGLAESARILARVNAVGLALLALLGGLGTVRLGHGLAALGLPDRLVQLFLMTVRYIAVIDQEYARLRLAMRARGFRLTSAPRSWAAVGTLFGMLLVRSLDRAERVQAAMRCRGFSGRFPVMIETRWRRADALFGLAAVLLAAAVLGLEAA